MKKYILGLTIVFALHAPVAVAATSFTVNAGWNLVNVQVLNALASSNVEGTSYTDRIEKKGLSLFILNPITGKYYGGGGSEKAVQASLQKAFDGMTEGSDSMGSLGVWVYTPTQISLNVDFALDFSANTSEKFYQKNYRLYKGWNLVGVTEGLVDRSLADVKGSCSIVSAYWFDTEWRKIPADDPEKKVSNALLGRALAIKVTDNCQFKFSATSTTPPVPALPE